MAKLALCMKAANAHPAIQELRKVKGSALFTHPDVIRSVLTQSELSMEDRATCETDPSFLQFIPYVACRTVKGQVFNYSRGGNSGETRLVGMMSVGLGGHVDEMPKHMSTLEEHLLEEATRELQEEIGLEVDPAGLSIAGILIDATTPVQEVHVGILCMYTLPEGKELALEEGVIEKGDARPIEMLLTRLAEFENWSKLTLVSLV